ncbi:uncharacterized protein LOC122556141 isoform X3 [Chiloscyllium plagiosum]|uniref:uncharacterized protein LOC122556141 isoform X3 n=1 Tax=Chiloscyllium plagiosum TaxID=36176 RepID=UPI001CB84BA0|nr:uncharacterized protein LOC122556141 isoform X3 [Chiloscyllium plagiosum]
MVDVLKNIGNNLTPNQLPPPQVLPSGPELVQYVENGPLNQTIAKMLTQNSAGVQEMLKAKFKFLGFVTAGSLAVAVERIPTVPMIRGCITLHIISAISCVPATIIYAISLAVEPRCFHSASCSKYEGAIACFAILLLLTLLNAAISIAVSSFNCKALNCCGTTSVPIIVVYNNTSEQLVPLQQLYANTPP